MPHQQTALLLLFQGTPAVHCCCSGLGVLHLHLAPSTLALLLVVLLLHNQK
jgi:hypothetical protein